MQDVTVHAAIHHHWHDLRLNDRYARYGIQSLLMAACILAYYQSPVSQLDFYALARLYVHPAVVALRPLVLVAGFGTAFALGIAGALRRERHSRIAGLTGAVVAASFLFEYRTVLSL